MATQEFETMWGVHNRVSNRDFVREGLIALDRPFVGDLARIGGDAATIKARLEREYREESPNTRGQWAGVLVRFAAEAQHGDLVVHPHRGVVSLGRLVSDYYWDPNDLHCRRVRWLSKEVPREHFSSQARQAVSGRKAFFRIPDDVVADLEAAFGQR